jgi:hypothetical protein
MKLYADLPGRRIDQIASDVFVVAWAALWLWLAHIVHDATIRLAEPGRRLEGAGAGFRGRMNDAGNSVANLPLLNDRIAEPLRDVAGVGTSIEDAGRQLVDAVNLLALILQLLTALVPILTVTLIWLFLRGRFVLRAAAAQRFIDADADLDLFAMRAIARQPMRSLARVSADPAGAWRRGDTKVIRQLALLELRDSGLRPPLPGGATGTPATSR